MSRTRHNGSMDMKLLQKKFAERLIELMTEKGLNKTELAAGADIPRSTISNWLIFNRSPQIDALYKLSEFLGCTIDYLIGKEN